MNQFRLDRAIAVRVAQPVRRVFGPSRGVPILMYHGINGRLGNAHPYFETTTSPEMFSRQMRYLKDSGYQPTSLARALAMLNSGEFDPSTVVITFDDGFRDFYTHAVPVLLENQFSATMFVVSDFVGTRQPQFGGNEFMSWEELREIDALGMEVGSHSCSHPKLYSLPMDRVEEQLQRSKDEIEGRLGRRVQSFSYPYAFPEQDRTFVRSLRGLLQRCGFDNGVTTVLGRAGAASDMYFLPRIPVNEHDDIRFFGAKLQGAYDWLHAAQVLYKTLRRPSRARLNRDIKLAV
jgi:peptidoglycan/xylan/chitin deacetylase (PgdA/CDA1 family)